jgi:hypothetical protein
MPGLEQGEEIMKSKVLLLVMACLLVTSPLALADTFVGTGGGNWSSLAGVPDGTPGPFWDNPSADGGPQNVGYKMNLQGLANPEYWSVAGLVDNNVFFDGVGSGQTQTLLIEIAGNAADNQLFAYNIADPTQTVQIFAGSVAPVTTVNVNIPYAQYGFYLTGPGGNFYSGSAALSSDSNSNFAFFRDRDVAGTWWFGVEDLRDNTGGEGVGDYNDMIVKVSTVPIPGAVWLLGSGLLGLLGFRRKFVGSS